MTIDLTNEENIKGIFKFIESNKERIDLNEKLFNIYEGQIGKQLDQKMIADLGQKTYDQAKERKVPINILKKIIDKKSKIYQQDPRRDVTIDGKISKKDEKILRKFEELLNIDHKFNIHNELFNLYLYGLIQIGNNNGTPFIRAIPNHRYLVMNVSHIDPTSADVIILWEDIEKGEGSKRYYWVYTDEQFVIYDSQQNVRLDIMAELDQDGKIPFGEKPFAYLSASDNLVMPLEQADTLDMTLLIPLLLTDTSYIAKFSSFSIVYTVDVDDSEVSMAPNAIWSLKSDEDTDKKPEVNMIKPQGDVEQLVKLAVTQLAIWLDSQGIKSGSIGDLTTSNVASGISKMIDDADISEIRRMQVMLYKIFEENFWNLLLKKIYPFWVEQNKIENFGTFSPNAKVVVNFAPQTAIIDRGQQVRDLKEEVEANFNTRKRAIKALNPQMNDTEIDELLKEIDEEEKANQEVISFGESIQQDTDTDNAEGSDVSS